MIVGFDKTSSLAREMCGMETIRERFEKLTDNFILKEYRQGNPRQWFEQRKEISTQFRNRRKIKEKSTRNHSQFNGPINYYRRRLSNLLGSPQDN